MNNLTNEPKIIKIKNSDSNILLEKMYDMLIKLDLRVQNIENKLEQSLFNKNSNDPLLFKNLIELKHENMIVDDNEVIKALSYRDFRSILYIFKLYYKNKSGTKYVYPIRISGKRSYEYYLNGEWNSDLYGYYSMKTICTNMQNLFIKINDLDNKKINKDDFLLNQEFIYKLSDEKYIKDIFKNIIEEVRINNP
jgi:hypothetical protein